MKKKQQRSIYSVSISQCGHLIKTNQGFKITFKQNSRWIELYNVYVRLNQRELKISWKQAKTYKKFSITTQIRKLILTINRLPESSSFILSVVNIYCHFQESWHTDQNLKWISFWRPWWIQCFESSWKTVFTINRSCQIEFLYKYSTDIKWDHRHISWDIWSLHIFCWH